MFRFIRFVLLFVVFVPWLLCAQEKPYVFRVRDEATAIKIAKLALEHEYGPSVLKPLKFFDATLANGKWTVTGHAHKRNELPPHGGAWDVIIADEGGCVLRILAEM